jgi:hypothetical protein
MLITEGSLPVQAVFGTIQPIKGNLQVLSLLLTYEQFDFSPSYIRASFSTEQAKMILSNSDPKLLGVLLPFTKIQRFPHLRKLLLGNLSIMSGIPVSVSGADSGIFTLKQKLKLIRHIYLNQRNRIITDDLFRNLFADVEDRQSFFHNDLWQLFDVPIIGPRLGEYGSFPLDDLVEYLLSILKGNFLAALRLANLSAAKCLKEPIFKGKVDFQEIFATFPEKIAAALQIWSESDSPRDVNLAFYRLYRELEITGGDNIIPFEFELVIVALYRSPIAGSGYAGLLLTRYGPTQVSPYLINDLFVEFALVPPNLLKLWHPDWSSLYHSRVHQPYFPDIQRPKEIYRVLWKRSKLQLNGNLPSKIEHDEDQADYLAYLFTLHVIPVNIKFRGPDGQWKWWTEMAIKHSMNIYSSGKLVRLALHGKYYQFNCCQPYQTELDNFWLGSIIAFALDQFQLPSLALSFFQPPTTKSVAENCFCVNKSSLDILDDISHRAGALFSQWNINYALLSADVSDGN